MAGSRDISSPDDGRLARLKVSPAKKCQYRFCFQAKRLDPVADPDPFAALTMEPAFASTIFSREEFRHYPIRFSETFRSSITGKESAIQGRHPALHWKSRVRYRVKFSCMSGTFLSRHRRIT